MAYRDDKQYGKTPKYKTPDEIIEKIEQYFADCKGTLLRDHNGDPMLTKWGDPIYLDRRPPTVTGLALALGFKTRQGLMRYQAKKEFMDIILEAKTRIEMYNEEMLYTRDGAKGAQFSLQCNFRGWSKEKENEEKGAAINIINDIPRGTVTVNTETAVFNPLKKPDEEETQNDSE